ncbi:uncharacterized protein LOC122074729 [Macadamia integrifolia]|uniref:uncharacterized protein LOC122074729 n=1 Tax=Macadamia integrifolia TaxID=60698 RepID=UPI001C4EDBC4|nr:uncharacterized protein LOC122074729 [Macadamia integrifolia]
MHRSSSTGRASFEFNVDLPQAVKASQGLKTMDEDRLPLYSSTSDDTKKEASSHKKSPGENWVHLIPLIVIICWVILWFFCRPVDIVQKPVLTVESVGGLNTNGHGNQISLLSSMKLKDIDQLEHKWNRKPQKTSVNE